MHIIRKEIYPAIIFTIIGIILLTTTVYAEEYYANVHITIQETGNIEITGVRNYPGLLINSSQEFTSKKGEYWMFNFNFSDSFLVYTYTITMPRNSVINYVHANVPLKISTLNDQTVLEGSGENEPLSLIIQYSISETTTKSNNSDFIMNNLILIIFVIICFILVVVGGIGFFFKKKILLKQPWYYLRPLTDRQKEILTIIEKKDSTTQRYLEKELKIPKSSLSRNVDALVRKGILRKESNGMTNTLIINKEKPDIKIPGQ